MKKFGISAIFALVFSIGLWAEPVETISNPTLLFSSAGITQSVDYGIPSGSLQLMSSSSDDVQDGIVDLIIEILGYLWGYNNLGVTYDSYPYATHPRYMCFDATSGYFPQPLLSICPGHLNVLRLWSVDGKLHKI